LAGAEKVGDFCEHLGKPTGLRYGGYADETVKVEVTNDQKGSLGGQGKNHLKVPCQIGWCEMPRS